MRRRRQGSWLGRLERRLLSFFGPAQLGSLGVPAERSAQRTAGVDGEWELRRDSTGRTYLVAPPSSTGSRTSQETTPHL